MLADELDVEEPLNLELGDDPVRDVVERGVGERDEVHRQTGAHRLARLRVAEHHPAADGDAVDRALATGCQLHHEELGAVLGEGSSTASSSRIATDPGRSCSSW